MRLVTGTHFSEIEAEEFDSIATACRYSLQESLVLGGLQFNHFSVLRRAGGESTVEAVTWREVLVGQFTAKLLPAILQQTCKRGIARL